MFVQVIRGRTSDPEGLARQGRKWRDEVAPGAEGFLGSTTGATADGEAVAIVRFADEASARRNSERPEQGAWWQETASLYDGEPTFVESSDVDQMAGGGEDGATFVQVMEGTMVDREAAVAFEQASEHLLRSMRPDLLGVFRVNHPDGRFTQTAYFSSEDAARAGESAEPDAMPAELAEGFAAYGENLKVDRYLDLDSPDLF